MRHMLSVNGVSRLLFFISVNLQGTESNCLCVLGRVSRKPRKVFVPEKPTLKVRSWKTKNILRFETLHKFNLYLNAKPDDIKSSVHKRLHGFWNGFSGPKSFRDVRETGPCSGIEHFPAHSKHYKIRARTIYMYLIFQSLTRACRFRKKRRPIYCIHLTMFGCLPRKSALQDMTHLSR